VKNTCYLRIWSKNIFLLGGGIFWTAFWFCFWSMQMITTQYFLLPSRHPIGCLDSLCNSVARFVYPIYVSFLMCSWGPWNHNYLSFAGLWWLYWVHVLCVLWFFVTYIFPNCLHFSFPFCSQWFNVDLVGVSLTIEAF